MSFEAVICTIRLSMCYEASMLQSIVSFMFVVKTQDYRPFVSLDSYIIERRTITLHHEHQAEK